MGDENMVPLSRLEAKNERIKDLERQLAESTMRTKDLEKLAGSAEKWKVKFEAERDQHVATRQGYDERFTLITAGVTDEADQHLVRWKYSQLAEDERPSLG